MIKFKKHRATEERYRESEQRYLTTVENSNDGIAIVVQDKLHYLNKRYLDIFGYEEASEILGNPIEMFVHPDDRERVLEITRRTRNRKDVPSRFEFKGITRDQNPIDIEVWAIRTTYNAEPASLIYLRDITETKLIAKRNSEQLTFLQTLIDAVPNPIFYKDIKGVYIGCNRAFEEYRNTRREELIGKTIADLNYLPEEISVHDGADIELMSKPGQKTYESTFADENGLDRTFITKKATFSDFEGNVAGIVGVVTDITEQKHIEEAMKEAMDASEAASRAKSDFLANMSHEIRTPMNAIIGMTDLLLNTALTEDQREFTEITKASADALLKIINDILDFSKIEAGKIDFEEIDFDLRVTMEDTIDTLAIKANEKGLELTCMIDPDLPSLLKGDPGRLRQILLNIIGNSIKFTDKGEVSVTAGLADEDVKCVTIRFSITDTGIGIPENRMEKLFKSFSQIDSSTSRKHGGTGLGLAISKSLSTLMGGDIGVTSEEGKGSNFWFTAKFEKQMGICPVKFTELKEAEKQRILIVDSNRTNLNILGKMLSYWGFRYVAAESTKQALEAMQEGRTGGDPFALAILDMHLPDIDGEILGERIKNDPFQCNTKLIMLSSFGKRGDVSRLKEKGFSAFLTKPVKGSQLYDCLLSVIREEDEQSKDKRIVTRFSIAEDKKRKLRILVAEDNISNQKLLLLTLNKMGYNADIAHNGREAVEMISKSIYDLVLMDIQMPDIDGLEATKSVRQKEKGSEKHLPIVALTANAMHGDKERCLEAGMDHYLSKPILPDKLLETIDKFFSDKHRSSRNISTDIKALFDVAALMKRLDIDEKLVGEIMDVYLHDTPVQISKLKEHFSQKDYLSVQRCAHSIKGASANFCVSTVNETARDIELYAKQGDFERIGLLVDTLEAQFGALKAELAEIELRRM